MYAVSIGGGHSTSSKLLSPTDHAMASRLYIYIYVYIYIWLWAFIARRFPNRCGPHLTISDRTCVARACVSFDIRVRWMSCWEDERLEDAIYVVSAWYLGLTIQRPETNLPLVLVMNDWTHEPTSTQHNTQQMWRRTVLGILFGIKSTTHYMYIVVAWPDQPRAFNWPQVVTI